MRAIVHPDIDDDRREAGGEIPSRLIRASRMSPFSLELIDVFETNATLSATVRPMVYLGAAETGQSALLRFGGQRMKTRAVYPGIEEDLKPQRQ